MKTRSAAANLAFTL